MPAPHREHQGRYDRQIVYERFGPEGQRRLSAATVLIVGVGGLGSALAELLCRAGVGRLRLADADRVELDNLHRQHLYTEADAAAALPKVAAAAERLREMNRHVAIEPHEVRVGPENILELMRGAELVLDGTDNWPTRFVLNDACVKLGVPWIYAGVVAGEAVTMNVIPGQTPCLRCIYPEPPPPCASPTCRLVGVLGPAVHMIAGWQAFEALKILTGHREAANRKLVRFELWENRIQEFDVARNAASAQCPCCKGGRYEFLEE